jgi:hypothetical protein
MAPVLSKSTDGTQHTLDDWVPLRIKDSWVPCCPTWHVVQDSEVNAPWQTLPQGQREKYSVYQTLKDKAFVLKAAEESDSSHTRKPP